MTIVTRKISDLREAEYNPRRLTADQEKQLRTSIEKYGFAEPIVVNVHPKRKNVIIGGHQRVAVAKKMGIAEIPCVELKLTIEQERELNVRLNKNTGEWDLEVLLQNFDPAELLDFGFDAKELDIDVGHLTDNPHRPGPVREKITVAFQLGEIRFEVTSSEYTAWMDGMVKEGNLTDKEKLACVKRRLQLP